MNPLSSLSASEAARLIASGEVKSEDLTAALIETISAKEERIGAWAYFDADQALAQARRADEVRRKGEGGGPLLGVPVGIKDIIDTADMPTENGTPVFRGRKPASDATVIRLLREAGAVIMGKTVTTELAVLTPANTRNPHNLAHTPGGSSSGSAAAVAANMVPLALGTQTNGSVIRPAAFCGVYGLKPTFGLISRHGVLEESPLLDTIGIFARSLEDLALTADVLSAYDSRDKNMWPRSSASLFQGTSLELHSPVKLAFIKTPVWDEAEPETKAAFQELAAALGRYCAEVVLPPEFDMAVALHRTVMFADIAKNYGPLLDRHPDKISPLLTGIIEEGRKVPAADYVRACESKDRLYRQFMAAVEGFDAVLTPAAPGPAPASLETTGNPIFCTMWTYLGTPAVSLPLLKSKGLPLGVQLVGLRRDDAGLLRTANWLSRFLKHKS